MRRIKREISSELEVMGKPKEQIEDLVNTAEALFIALRVNGCSEYVNDLLGIFKAFDGRGFTIIDYNSVSEKLGSYGQPIIILWECLVLVFGDFANIPKYGYIADLKGCIKYLEEMRPYWEYAIKER